MEPIKWGGRNGVKRSSSCLRRGWWKAVVTEPVMSLLSEMTRMRSDTNGQSCITVSVSPSRFLSVPFLGPLVRCVVATCESAPSKHARMIIEVRTSPIARDFQALHATQTVTNTANTHTHTHAWTHIFISTYGKSCMYSLSMECESFNLSHSPRDCQQVHRATQTQVNTHV